MERSGRIRRSVWFRGSFDARLECIMEPLGLVAKMNTWYLVGRVDGFPRVLKTSDILEVFLQEEGFTRQDGFNLQAFWEAWCNDTQHRRWVYPARLRMSPGLLSKLGFYLDDTERYVLEDTGSEDVDGWKEVGIQFESFFRARECVLSFGRAAEVLEPDALRLSVVDFARQILSLYQV
ncbi:MAG: WYL domain-containing protein [Anaerolineae bacterium]|nr:WYL domain-containing protein [Anaerolineae bacterium]